jgi:diaminohydroxyphosphoribosylaminopyrimidine deaminase/5-amino-6-(5-phosphoribosylamino)uracil reductase
MIKYLEVENFDHYLPQMIAYQLYIMDIQSIIVEGGAKTLELFIRAGLWDEARIFTGPQRWAAGIPAPVLKTTPSRFLEIGEDRLEIHYNNNK